MSKYDLVVVGAGIGGIAAAARASRMKKRTIVLEPGNAVGGSLRTYRQNDFSFYLGPALSFGFERGGVFQQLNEALGIAQSASIRSPCYQVALPDRRITVYAEHSETLAELRREYPLEIDKIVRFYHDVRRQSEQNAKGAVSAFLSRHKTASGFLQRYRFSPEFTAFLDVQAHYFFLRPASALSQTSLVTLFDSAPFTIEGGFRGLTTRILDILLSHGGEIRYQVPLESITIRRRGLDMPDQSIEAEAVLLNTEWTGRTSYVVNGIKADVVPVGMLPDVLCVPEYAHPERFFLLNISSADDRAAAPPGMRALTGCFFNSPGASIDERRKQMAELIPFLNDFTVFGGEYRPLFRESGIDQKKLSFKAVRTAHTDLLQRSSVTGVFMLPDGIAAPLHSIAAVQQFMRFIK